MSVSVSPPLTWDSATSPWFEGNSDMHLSRLVHESFDENPIIGPFTIDFTPSAIDDYSDHEGSLKIIFSNAGPVTFIDPNTNLPLDVANEHVIIGQGQFLFSFMVDSETLNDATSGTTRYVDPAPWIKTIERTRLIEWHELSLDPPTSPVPFPTGGTSVSVRAYLRHVARKQDLGFWGTTTWPGGFVLKPVTIDDELTMYNNNLIVMQVQELPGDHGKITFIKRVNDTQWDAWREEATWVDWSSSTEDFPEERNPGESPNFVDFLVRPYNSSKYTNANGDELQVHLKINNLTTRPFNPGRNPGSGPGGGGGSRGGGGGGGNGSTSNPNDPGGGATERGY